jgi:uncharacterized protein DUF4332
MEIPISEFECIGEEYAKILKSSLNINEPDDFYQFTLQQVLDAVKVDKKRVQQWFDVLDLFRIPKISVRDAELLYYANINSVEELSHRQASRIYYKLQEIDVETYLIILQLPTFADIGEWIYYAKIMTKRIKSGLSIPLIKLPMVGIKNAAEMSKYFIFTLEDYLAKSPLIKGIRKILKMDKNEFAEMVNMIDMLKIDGIDVYFADVLFKAGINSVELLESLNPGVIFERVQAIQQLAKTPKETLTLNQITDIKANIVKEVA